MRLRRAPGRQAAVTAAEIEALERDLDASISHFRETVDEQLRSTGTSASAASRATADFPALDRCALDRGPEIPPGEAKKPGSLSPAGPLRIAEPTLPDTEAAIADALERLRLRLERLATDYNAARPPVHRPFVVGPDCELGILRWESGYVDAANPDFEAAAVPGTFALNYKLSAPGAATLQVDSAQTQSTVEILLGHDLAFTLRDGASAGHPEVLFNVSRELRCRLAFRPDHEYGRVVVDTRHCERLGPCSYAVDARRIDGRCLAELAEFLGGRRPRLPAPFVERKPWS